MESCNKSIGYRRCLLYVERPLANHNIVETLINCNPNWNMSFCEWNVIIFSDKDNIENVVNMISMSEIDIILKQLC